MTRSTARLRLTLLGLTWAACSPSVGHPPTARIALTPAYVPIGASATVTLDGTGSSNALDDPQALHPLGFAWSIEDPTVVLSPDAASARVTAQIMTLRPLVVHLTVTDFQENSGEAAATIGVTVP